MEIGTDIVLIVLVLLVLVGLAIAVYYVFIQREPYHGDVAESFKLDSRHTNPWYNSSSVNSLKRRLQASNLKIDTKTSHWVAQSALEQLKSDAVKKPRLETMPRIDLHGLKYDTAEQRIYDFLREHRGQIVEIVTGRGNSSINGKPVLKPLLVDILEGKNLEYTTRYGGGSFIIKNFPQAYPIKF